MATVYCKLFIIARITSLKPSVTIQLQQRATGPIGRKEPNHLNIGIYSKNSSFYDLLHTANWASPTSIQVQKRGPGKPTDKQMHTAAQQEIRKRFPSLELEELPTTRSVWTGTYWHQPKNAEFAAGFRFLDSDSDAITGILGAVTTAGKQEPLELDFIALVQSL